NKTRKAIEVGGTTGNSRVRACIDRGRATGQMKISRERGRVAGIDRGRKQWVEACIARAGQELQPLNARIVNSEARVRKLTRDGDLGKLRSRRAAAVVPQDRVLDDDI